MVISQGEVWWVLFPDPDGSEPRYERPAIVLQGNHLNHSGIGTTVVAPMTGNLKWAPLRGNLLLSASSTGLERDSVAQLSGIIAVNKNWLRTRCGKLEEHEFHALLECLDDVLER